MPPKPCLSLVLSLFLALLAVPSGLASETSRPPEPSGGVGGYREFADGLVRAALREGRAYEKLEELCRIAPHRLSGSEGAARAVAWAHQAMIRDGLQNVRLSCRTLEDRESHNVVGELIGSEKPEEVIVVGGHLDAWDVGEGAHDDGAGCVQAMEAVRLVKDSGLRPRRTLRVVLFMNEENGLKGGQGYYQDHLEEMGHHVMALESDRGGFTPRGFSTDANPQALAVLERVGGLLDSIGADEVVSGYGGVDISPMRAAGVVNVGYVPDSQRYFDYHHSRKDVISAVNERELELGAASMAALIGVVADLPERLPANEPRAR